MFRLRGLRDLRCRDAINHVSTKFVVASLLSCNLTLTSMKLTEAKPSCSISRTLTAKFTNYTKITQQFIIYGFIGIIAMTIDFLCVYIFTETFLLHYLTSIVLGYLIAATVNYSLQKKLTFKNKSTRYMSQFSAFFSVGLIGMGINLITVYISVEFFGLWYMFGKVIATGIAYIWNFSVNKLFTFNRIK